MTTSKNAVWDKIEFTTDRFYGPAPQKITAIIVAAHYEADWDEFVYDVALHDEVRSITGVFKEQTLLGGLNKVDVMSMYDSGQYESISARAWAHFLVCDSIQF